MKENSAFSKLCRFIVNNRRLIFIIFIALCAVSVITSDWVEIDEELTDYLPEDTETRQGLDLLEEEFTNYGTAEVMVENISYGQAEALADEISSLEDVKDVEFSSDEDHYQGASALFLVTFTGDTNDEESIRGLNNIKEQFSEYDLYINSEIGNPLQTIINKEMLVVDAIALVVVLIVLLFTCRSFGEIPVLLLTFGAAALLNIGTNFIFGTICFVTDSVAVVLQLALALDYAIILCHRYENERKQLDVKDAVIAALEKAIPEILASSLTTIAGLLALTFMEYRLGADLGWVLIKAILLSLLSVFFLMPGLLMIFSRMIDNHPRRGAVPHIGGIAKVAHATRFIIPFLFIGLVVLAYTYSGEAHYVYIQDSIDSIRHNENQLAEQRIEEHFGRKNTMAIVVPAGDYDSEYAIAKEVEALPYTYSVTALSDVEVKEGYTMKDSLTPRQFAEMLDMDVEMANLLYTAYARSEEELGLVITNLNNYQVPLLDMMNYVVDNRDDLALELSEESMDDLDELEEDLEDGKRQLTSDNWSRIIVKLDLDDEEEMAHEYLDIIRGICARYYTEIYLVSNTTSAVDLEESFQSDNVMISALSIAFVILVLVLTFKSVGLPLLLIMIIQGSIWINFSRPYVTDEPLYFLVYLIISAIQMGANIDYAIVISSHYLEMRKTEEPKNAMRHALNLAFPTIITSGTILALSGVAIGLVASNESISSIGVYLGQGTGISIFLVIFVLPQVLLLGDKLILKTTFTITDEKEQTSLQGKLVHLDGKVSASVNGYLVGEVHGYFRGDLVGEVSIDTTEEMQNAIANEAKENTLPAGDSPTQPTEETKES